MAQEIIIEAGRTEAHYWRDLWRYRELFGFLAWRDILVRYKQTFLGAAWAVLRPLLIMFVGVFFRRVTNMSATSGSTVPDSIFVLVALLPWQFFANALTESGNSLVGNANLISKIYFPRMILPLSSIIVALVDFAITLVLLALTMLWFQYLPPLRVLAATARPETAAAPPGTVVWAEPGQGLLVACGASQLRQLDIVALDEGYFTGGQLAALGVPVGEVLGLNSL